jgi:hypothetical protein
MYLKTRDKPLAFCGAGDISKHSLFVLAQVVPQTHP